MLVLGLQGSPRRKGNTNYLLNLFMEEVSKYGAETHIIDVDKANILPCKEYIVCEKKGYCPIDDDMKTSIYSLLREAEVIVAATPIFFYNTTAQLKILIDRTQTLWARKYKLNLTDPARKTRRGYTLAIGATKGKNLFEGLHLTMKYFYDAVGASYHGSLTYWKVEHLGDMAKHPTVHEDVKIAVEDLMKPYQNRKKVLFACRENACRSQMAAAFAKYYAGDKLDVLCGGSEPVETVNPVMVEAMQEKGIDMGFIVPKSIDRAIEHTQPEFIITMGCGEACPVVPGAKRMDWELPDPAGKQIEFMRSVRDSIEEKIKEFSKTLDI